MILSPKKRRKVLVRRNWGGTLWITCLSWFTCRFRNVSFDCSLVAFWFSLYLVAAMAFLDIQKRLGISLDKHLTISSAKQPFRIPSRCHAFEKEWIECAHGIGGIRAEKECKLEYEDFKECFHRNKMVGKWWRWELKYVSVACVVLVLSSPWQSHFWWCWGWT